MRLWQPRPSLSRVDLVVVSSPGGHLFEMLALKEVWSGFSRLWVTLDTEDTRCILRGEPVVHGYAPTTRSMRNLAKNLTLAFRILRETQPSAVLATGAGLSVAFTWAARALGISTIYLECGGRIDRPSLSCRLIAPVADRVYVQSKELLAQVPHSHFAGRVPIPELATRPPCRPAATGDRRDSLFVTVGANRRYPFDRLVQGAATLAQTQTVRVQHGISLLPAGLNGRAFFAFEQLTQEVVEAQTIVTHGGIGSIMLALATGKRPIVAARRRRYGESVDDHQVAFAAYLSADGLADVIVDMNELPAVVATSKNRPTRHPRRLDQSPLVEELRELLASSRSHLATVPEATAGDAASA